MLEIKKSPYRRSCDSRKCNNTEVYIVGQQGESPSLAKFYCKDHLIEIAVIVNKMFGLQQNIEVIPVEPLVSEQDLNKLIQENVELKAEIEKHKSSDIELLKANLESEKASNELFKEKISTLESEIKRLKQSNKGNKLGKSKSKK